MIRVGDTVKPKPEWENDPNRVPSGRVVRIEPWGSEGAIHVEGERRVFAAYVFEKVEGADAPHQRTGE